MTTEFTRELAELAERVKRQQEVANQRARNEYEKRYDEEARELVKDKVGDLKDRMKKAAAKGQRRLTLVSNSWGYFHPDQEMLWRGYLLWAIGEGIDTFHDEHPGTGSDGDPSEYAGLRW